MEKESISKSSYSNKFIDTFGNTIGFISAENISDINRMINELGTQKRVDLDINALTVIQEIVFTLKALKKKGIDDSKSYLEYVKNYKKFVSTALNDYGISIRKPLPCSNPIELYKQIDFELSKSGLTKEQKKYFFSIFTTRKRIPLQKDTIEKLSKSKLNNLIEDYRYTLTDGDKLALTKNARKYNFSKAYSDILDKYSLDEIPITIINHDLEYREKEDLEDLKRELKEVDSSNKNIKIRLEHLFLDYPMYKFTVPKFILEQNIDFICYASKKYKLSNFPSIDEAIEKYHSSCQ